MSQTILDLGIQFIQFLRGLGEWLAEPMILISLLGNEEFFLLFMPIFYWSLDSSIGLRMGIMLLVSNGINAAVKLAFHAPRPYFSSTEVLPLRSETTFGLPSAHAQNAAAVWGLLAALVRLPWVWILALVLIFLIGVSRMYLAVHFPTDVLVGWLIGALLVWAFLKLEKPVLSWLRRQTLTGQILTILGASLGLILLGVLARLSLGAWMVPAAWLENVRLSGPELALPEPLVLSHLFTSAGALFGFGAGAAWLASLGGFDAGGTEWRRALRYILGVAGVALIWFGLGAIFPRGEFLLSYLLRYIRYTLVGVWISALAPLLFLRVGLAGSPPHKEPLPAQDL